jgi:hypothetical protein
MGLKASALLQPQSGRKPLKNLVERFNLAPVTPGKIAEPKVADND